MKTAKELVGSMKTAATTKEHTGISVTAKNASQMRGRTGAKTVAGNLGHTAASHASRKSSTGKRGSGK